MFLGFITLKTALLIIHVFGVVIGAGAAFLGDGIFFKSVKDGKLNGTEYSMLKLSSRYVWIGLLIIILSGIGIFLLDVEGDMASSKFLSKMTIVAIIAINGFAFHRKHLPCLEACVEQQLSQSKRFQEHKRGMMISGAISVTSWSCALILGMFSGVPYSYWTIMAVYVGLVIIAIIGSQLIGKKLI